MAVELVNGEGVVVSVSDATAALLGADWSPVSEQEPVVEPAPETEQEPVVEPAPETEQEPVVEPAPETNEPLRKSRSK